MNRISLKYRIALIILMLEAVMLTIVLWRVGTVSYSELTAAFHKQHGIYMDLVSDMGRNALVTSEYGELQLYVDKLKKLSVIEGIFITDHRDVIVVSSEHELLSKLLPTAEDDEKGHWDTRNIALESGGNIGSLHIKFSNNTIHAAQRKAFIHGITVAGFSMLLIAVAGLMIGYFLVRRLEKLNDAARKMSEGHLDTRADISGSDEVAQLCETFNGMSQKIQASMVSLNKSEKSLKEAQHIAHLGSWQWTLATDTVQWSEELYHINGRDSKLPAPCYAEMASCYTPESWKRLREAVALSVESGAPYELDLEIVRPDGTTRHTAVKGEAEYDDNGKIVGLQGTVQDITERKRAEKKLLESEEFIRNILNTVDEGFIVVDRDYRILTANSAYCRDAGYADGKIIGKHCYEVSHRIDQPCHEQGEDCAVQQVFKTGESHAILHRHPDAEGNMLYVETKGYPIKDGSGNVTSVIETINNITEKHLLEEERLKTQKLESIGSLAGGIAHDFNNLLQGVFGFIALAKMNYDKKEESFSMLEQAEEALHLSVNLTNQLLTFSKGGKPIKKLIRVTPAIENAVKFALSGSNANYELDVQDGLWRVEADEGQLAQVIQNIVLNANQSMADGGTVRVTLSNKDVDKDTSISLPDGGQFVCIAIQDSGIGINEQNLTRIFDPYFTTKQKGSGLGLATSYSIIKNHGGTIEVESEVNSGTTFTIYIPASMETEAEIVSMPSPVIETKKGRILLMDDEEMIRNVAQAMITSMGHDIVCAEDGCKAIDLFREAKAAGLPFDLVILDLTVKGGMGGEDAIRNILEIDPEVKAIVSSGYADSPVVANYRAYGFSEVLNKPYQLDMLKYCLDQYVQRE